MQKIETIRSISSREMPVLHSVLSVSQISAALRLSVKGAKLARPHLPLSGDRIQMIIPYQNTSHHPDS